MKTKLLFFIYLTYLFVASPFGVSFVLELNAQVQTIPDSSLWPTSPDSGLIIGYGYLPLIVGDGEGGTIIAYRTNMQVKLKRVDRYGALQWNGWNGVIAGGIEDEQLLIDVAEDGEGGILVSFTDVDQINMFEAYEYATVQHIDHDGNKLWGNGIRLTVIDSLIQYNPQIASDGKGGCIVNFLDNRFAANPSYPDFDIFIQRIDSLGNRCWGDSAFRLTDSTRSHASNPMMLVNENSETFFSWWDGLTTRLQKIDLNGNKLWIDTGIPISNFPGKISISDKKGGFFTAGIIYQYSYNIYQILSNRIDSTGQKLWGADGITLVDSVLFGSGQSDVTGILFDDVGNIIISYFFSKSGQPDTYLQKLTPDGIKLFGDEGINVSDTSAFSWGGGMVESENNILCLWNDGSPATSFASRYDYSGNMIWNDKKRIFNFGDFTTDGQGGLITVVFLIDFSISLSKISKNGNIGEVISSIDYYKNDIILEDFILYQNYPNPFNGKTIIKYWLNKSDKVELKIFSITGKTIQRYFIPKQMQGEHQKIIDMYNFASGLYLYQLSTGKHSQVKKFLLIK